MIKKETITTYQCDDCGTITSKEQSLLFPTLAGMELLFCFNCIRFRLLRSLDNYPLGATKCERCRGKGKIKDFYCNNDYNWISCDKCSGVGSIKL